MMCLFVAEFIGEAMIFGLAGTFLLMEAARNNRVETTRRALIEQRFQELFERVRDLESVEAREKVSTT